jgi:hypothetical protein
MRYEVPGQGRLFIEAKQVQEANGNGNPAAAKPKRSKRAPAGDAAELPEP